MDAATALDIALLQTIEQAIQLEPGLVNKLPEKRRDEREREKWFMSGKLSWLQRNQRCFSPEQLREIKQALQMRNDVAHRGRNFNISGDLFEVDDAVRVLIEATAGLLGEPVFRFLRPLDLPLKGVPDSEH